MDYQSVRPFAAERSRFFGLVMAHASARFYQLKAHQPVLTQHSLLQLIRGVGLEQTLASTCYLVQRQWKKLDSKAAVAVC